MVIFPFLVIVKVVVVLFPFLFIVIVSIISHLLTRALFVVDGGCLFVCRVCKSHVYTRATATLLPFPFFLLVITIRIYYNMIIIIIIRIPCKNQSIARRTTTHTKNTMKEILFIISPH